ncbi:transcription factor with AP2 domain-containing protein [Babesia ovata]|uniref:Transcription factor with AP2 domain-containing protein n=1 Tax=Babesia ovata TaxID=189622 RepID=A0A2H6KFN3_9APIC|nr:transcription factor with AP2 domain-containing protein [Babesia ovata]GBE61800.1 transcription factor with AP2 domain-containing protein [Babesia ovata]
MSSLDVNVATGIVQGNTNTPDLMGANASVVDTVAPTAQVSPVVRNTTGRGGNRGSNRKVPIPPPPRASPSSSSGYPGVSWNKRMGAWLSFYYDADTRRSRTFHPKYYDFDVEKAKQAAIEFMKSIEKHPRCSLRKSRRDAKNAAFLNGGYNFDPQYLDIPGRTRKRAAVHPINNSEYKTRSSKNQMNMPANQNTMSEMYDMESLKRNFQMTSNFLDPCYGGNSGSMDSGEYINANNVLENNYLSGSFESQQDFDKGYQSPMTWPACQSFFGNPEYYMDSQNYSVPFLEGDMAYTSPSNVYSEGDLPYAGNSASSSQQVHGEQVGAENQESQSQNMFVGNYEMSPTNEDAEIHMLMQSIALSPSESFDGLRPTTYNYGDGTSGSSGSANNNAPQPYSNSGTTPLGSPYLSPYVQTIYNQFPEDSDLNRTFGFQNLILANETQPNQQTQSAMHSQS